MISAEKITGVLQAKIDLLRRLKDESLGGFAVIFPPDGAPTELLLMGSELDNTAFYKILVSHLGQSAENAQYGGTRGRVL